MHTDLDVKRWETSYGTVTTASHFVANTSLFYPSSFAVEILGGTSGLGYLSRDQARQLRDELTTFLGEPKCQRCAANEHLLSELPGLWDANDALRRDNADLTRQQDRLIASNEHQTEVYERRIADLEAENARLRDDLALLWPEEDS